MALDTLRAALWSPSDVALDCTGQRFYGWRGCLIRAELHYWRCHRWVRLGLAVDCCNLVCTPDRIPTDCRIVSASWKCADGKGFTDLWKWLMFPTTFNTLHYESTFPFVLLCPKQPQRNQGHTAIFSLIFPIFMVDYTYRVLIFRSYSF